MAEATEEHCGDQGGNDLVWLVTCSRPTEEVCLSCGAGGHFFERGYCGCPQRAKTREAGTQTVADASGNGRCSGEIVFVFKYGECYHVEVACMGLWQARTTLRKRRCHLCVDIDAATPRRGDERNNIYCLHASSLWCVQP
eukprot:2153709-Amphidinium_carterae.1